MENINTISTIRSEVSRLRLLGLYLVLALPLDVLAAAYNGTGPEFLPDSIRAKLDSVCRPFLPAFMVHDVDFTRSDGTVGSFRSANRRLLVNCILCALDAHQWYSWRRYALIIEAWAIYRACSQFGWIPWILAYNKTQNKKGKHE